MDILDAIDAAMGCQQCGGPLGDSPSADFCGDGCQQAWHAARADELVGYREPWERPGEFPGIGGDEYVRREFRLPPESADLNADLRALRLAVAAAITDDQRAAVRLRAESLNERNMQRQRELAEAMLPTIVELGERLRVIWEGLVPVFQAAGEALAKAFAGLREAGLVPDDPPANLRERALAARRNRNTGPARRERAPRSIGRASTSARR